MEPLDNDMDDLFRKAAADYPLNPGKDDWEKLSDNLLLTPPVAEVSKKNNYKYYGLMLLALLLFLILGGLFIYKTRGSKKIVKTKYTHSAIDSLKPAIFKNHGTDEAVSVYKDERINDKETPGSFEKKTRVQKTVTVNQHNKTISKDIYSNSKTGSQKTGAPSRKATQESSFIVGQVVKLAGQNISEPENDVSEPKYILKSTLVESVPLKLQYAILDPTFLDTPVKILNNGTQQPKGLYLGITGGPELSKVGSQSSSKAGYHAGILLGYRFNRRLSAESGIMLGKKGYYSAGKYFSMSKIAASMPSGMEIVTVDGQSTQLEIPLKLKYDFRIHNQPGFFVTAGSLSNILLREKNKYQTMLNGVEDNQVGLYSDNHYFIASELQISAGYEHSLGRSFIFRIEPYKKIPLKKTGMGSMTVFSSGVNVAVVHLFGR